MKSFSLLFITVLLFSCSSEKKSVDLLVTNATIYTVNAAFDTAEAFVVKDGRIVEVAPSEVLQKKYQPKETFDADGKTILPGLIDGHAHLYNLGTMMRQVDLIGTTSAADVLQRVIDFQKTDKSNIILGRGWDQNDWEVKEYPTKAALDSLFPNTPVALKRVDGHAYWVNSKALELAGITSKTKMSGGEVVLIDGQLSGILIDNPMDLIDEIIPKPTKEWNTATLKLAEKKCFELGLTTINDAGNSLGIDRDLIPLIDELQQAGELKIRVYTMVGNTPKNLDYFLDKGKIKTDRLNVRSIKVYADGALGSRGAALREAYSDKKGHFGAMITPMKDLEALAKRIAAAGYQMNTHAIGDSANASVLRAYRVALKYTTDARWKVEHAQVVSPEHFRYFSGNIIPSVQPTHATSDMYWAEDRVGPVRIKGAYAYKSLLKRAKIIVLGTDFPVERVNPMHTFYASVARKDLQNYPEDGYRMEEALTREETLRGMTIWAAYSNFEEDEKGSIEAGKFADFVVLDKDIMTCEEDEIPKIKVLGTFVGGEKVF
jgi:hypothetical protein